jgi:hypothetical protein
VVAELLDEHPDPERVIDAWEERERREHAAVAAT